MFYKLPPVGNPICLSVEAGAVVPVLPSADTRYYSSGTAALAAAISAAIKKRDRSGCRIQEPEIILPAYACPDLLSAIVYCGAKPVLVDIAKDRPWLDLEQLASAMTENTVAVIAVSLFGIAERWQQLREVVADDDIILIEDSAQYFPGSDEHIDWQGDLVVFSFGRGKPVSLLGGGAVLCQKTDLYNDLPDQLIESRSLAQRFTYNMKAWLYNAVISPYLYWLPESLPFLHLGETRYHRLHTIGAMDEHRFAYLARNMFVYQNEDLSLLRIKHIKSVLQPLESVVNLPEVCEVQENRRLLRYPILLEEAKRDRCFQELVEAGLGASVLYPTSLPNIEGVDEILDDCGTFPNAEAFASRLLTLPTHANVDDADIEKMRFILTKFA